MGTTRFGLSEAARETVAGELQPLLYDALDLAARVKQAHWRVRGANFIAVHEWLDGLRTQFDEHVDTIAERIVTLGSPVNGTLQTAAKSSRLPTYDGDIDLIPDHMKALFAAFEVFERGMVDAARKIAEHGDDDTADILTGVSRDAAKTLWMLEAQLE